MIKIKFFFLLTSVFMTYNLAASALEPGEDSQKDSTAQKDSIANINNNINHQQSATQGSSFFTKAFYGAAAAVGKSRAKIFLELYHNGILEQDLIAKPKIAEDRLRDAIEERCKDRDLKKSNNQATIFDIFAAQKTLAIRTNKPFALDQQRANEYNPLLGEALQAITKHHATIIQPQLDQKRKEAKAAADLAYETEMKDVHLAFAAQTASNKRYLHEQAKASEACNLQDEKHYQDLISYENLLTLIREEKDNK